VRHALPLAALLALAACSQPATRTEETKAAAPAAPAAKVDPALPGGTYHLDPMHSTALFKVSHIGFSNYVATFDRIEGALQLDPKQPEAASVQAAIDVRSLDLPAPPAGFLDDMLGATWFDANRCPQITFRSTKVTRTGEATADITGDLTMKCVTKPATLKARFNGGYPPGGLDPYGARIGFSAEAVIKRSEFGLSYGLPPPGSSMGVSDEVRIEVETEFTSRKEPAPMPAQPAQ
jgi:polyisoprenoid-binding protein YceI